jgi:hypothetical protein
MKNSYFILFCLLLSIYLPAQINLSLECQTTFNNQGSQRALTGGAYKPSSNATGQYFRALVVFVQFDQDNSVVADWTSVLPQK